MRIFIIDDRKGSDNDGRGNAAGGIFFLLLLLLIFLAYKGICLFKDTKTKWYNSELLENTIQDINTLTNNKEKITLEQCLVYVQFDSRCVKDDYFNFIPEGYLSKENEEKCSTQKDKIYCEHNYISYSRKCDSDGYECWIEDNSLFYHDNLIPCSKKLKNSLDKTIMTHCIELVYEKCHPHKCRDYYKCRDPFWNGITSSDGEKKHDGLDYRDAIYWDHLAYSYKKLTGREPWHIRDPYLSDH